jgi:pantetheine-phosphate adenylyltransferase
MRIAVYAGTFDPITQGHLSVIKCAAQMFDQLVVVVAVNPNKQPLFSLDERMQMIREVTSAWPNVECASADALVVAFARQRNARYLVRGVRTSTDIDGELTLANMNHDLAPEIKTVFIPAHPELSEVSSSRLKDLAQQGKDISEYCPPELEARLRERLRVLLPAREVAHD